MNQVNWEAMSEPVRQFIRGLVIAPEGSVIVRNGEPIVRVMPISKPALGSASEVEWSAAANERRCGLIDREIAGTLTPDERIELEDLQEQMLRYRHRMAPLPLESLRIVHRELLEKAAILEPGSHK